MGNRFSIRGYVWFGGGADEWQRSSRKVGLNFSPLRPQPRSINWIMGLSCVHASDVRLQFSR